MVLSWTPPNFGALEIAVATVPAIRADVEGVATFIVTPHSTGKMVTHRTARREDGQLGLGPGLELEPAPTLDQQGDRLPERSEGSTPVQHAAHMDRTAGHGTGTNHDYPDPCFEA